MNGVQGAWDRAPFLAQLRRLVRDEALTARQNVEATWRKPLPQRVAEGRAVEGVRLAGWAANGQIELTCERNASRFREGDLLRLHRGDPRAEPHITVTLQVDDETRLAVSLQGLGADWVQILDQAEGWFLDEDMMDLSPYYLEALDAAGDTVRGRERILPLLMGQARPTMDAARLERGLAYAELRGLNWSQGEALAQAYASDLTYLIQGPPGTGKTQVLAHLARLLVEEGERVLVTALTHRAINNAINKIVAVAPQIPAIKIGQATRADDLAAESYETFAASPLAGLTGGYVAGATPFATRTRRLSGVEFDTVIFDEASQVTLPLAVMGMLPAQRFIFIGDQRQLPPVLAARIGSELARSSIFGALVERGFDTMLAETYRMNAELTEWPSRQFYDGILRPVPAVAGRRVAYGRPPVRLAQVLDPAEPKVFLDLGHRNTTTRSRGEADAVADLVSTLLACGCPAGEIGIVTPYRAQGRAIRNLLRQVVTDPAQRREIVCDTVERMQGQERDVIIVSLTTSNPAFAADLAEFFFQPERLNVAITRARKKLIIVGSRHVLSAEPPDPELAAGVAMLADLLGTCARCSPNTLQAEDLTFGAHPA
jgi:DNA replication ATP-dependent helicase Dna2